MELITSGASPATLLALIVAFLVFGRTYTLGALSLPCITILTSIIYFYIMPALAFSGKNYPEFLGVYLQTLEWPHVAVFLYIVGALTAALVMRRYLMVDPSEPRQVERELNMPILIILASMAIAGLVAQISLGRLSFSERNPAFAATDASELAFVNLFFTMMVSLTIVVMIRANFTLLSWLLLAVVSLILLQTGFRYRLVLMAFGVASSFMLKNHIRVRVVYVVVGMFFGLLGSNMIVIARTYGHGLDFSKLEGLSWLDIAQSFGGEVGPLFSFSFVASNPLPDLVYGTPWVVAALRLVPSFLWRDKPSSDYLDYYFSAFGRANAKEAGVAAPQHVEMLLQFGWIGLPVLAFLYFYIAILIVKKLDRLGRESRIAGFSLVPAFFGFYMQTRGYFFQIFSDGLFLFMPLFVLYLGDRKRAKPAAKAEAGLSARRAAADACPGELTSPR